ncbi:MAG: metallophosphoesterase [Porticoccaceae bacterium]
MDTVHLTQITDLHLGIDASATLGGVPTLASFEAVLQAVADRGRGSDRLLLTGDLASDCQPEAYRLLNSLLKAHHKQATWLPGNHDDSELMADNLRDFPPQSVVDLGAWGLLTLDSSQPNQPGGHISEAQLQHVAQGLHALADKHILLAMHHSPIPMGCAWLDRQQIDNQQQLQDLLCSQGNVRAVITGHVHQQFDGHWGQLPIYSTPSSCVQFKQHSDDFALSEQPPGYRWLDLHSDGTVHTGVEFLADFAPAPNLDCASY